MFLCSLSLSIVFFARFDKRCWSEDSCCKQDSSPWKPLPRVFECEFLGPSGEAPLSSRYGKEEIKGGSASAEAAEDVGRPLVHLVSVVDVDA